MQVIAIDNTFRIFILYKLSVFEKIVITDFPELNTLSEICLNPENTIYQVSILF